MAGKRPASTVLDHDNWDQDNPADHEEIGTFKAAPREVLEKRVIRTARRRTQPSGGERKGAFSGFGGFNKAQPSSFDFLANLTNGSQANKSEATVSSSLFSNKPITSSMFNAPVSSSENVTNLGNSNQPKTTSTLFEVSSTNTVNPSSIFTTSKADSTIGSSVFKIQPTTSVNDSLPKTKAPQVTSSIFGGPAKRVRESLEPEKKSVPTFQSEPANAPKSVNTFLNVPKPSPTIKNNIEKKEDKSTSKSNTTPIYYAKLKDLNIAVLEWIKKHVNESPICILSPIFKDYDKYLKNIREKYDDTYDKTTGETIIKNGPTSSTEKQTSSNKTSIATQNTEAQPKFTFGIKTTASPTANTNTLSSQSSIFGNKPPSATGPAQSFTFGIKTTPTSETKQNESILETDKKNLFSVGNKSTAQETKTLTTGTFSFTNKPSTPDKASDNSAKDTHNFTFGIKSTAQDTKTSPTSTFSFTNKTSNSAKVSENPTKDTQNFTFGIKSTAQDTKTSPTSTFSFTNKTSNSAKVSENPTKDTQNFTFGIKSTALDTKTSPTSTFSFTNKTSNSAKVSENPTKDTQNFTFGIKSTAQDTKTSPTSTFSFTNKTITSAKVSENPTKDTQNSLMFGIKPTAQDTKTSPTSIFSFANKSVKVAENSAKDKQNFTFGIKSTAQESTTTPTISFTDKTSTTDVKSNDNPLKSNTQNFSFGNKSAGTTSPSLFSFTDKTSTSGGAKEAEMPTKVGSSQNFSFGVDSKSSPVASPPSFSFTNKTASPTNSNLFNTDAPQNKTFGTPQDKTTSPSSLQNTSKDAGNNKNTSSTFSDKTENNVSSTPGKINAGSPSKFSFTPTTSSSTFAAAPFSFSGKSPFSSSTTTPTTGISFGSNNALSTSNAPFSFGTGKPFSFNSSVENKAHGANENTEKSDEPPKVEYTPVVEENSVYDKKCKIFVKKDENYMDKGVGTLFIKTITDSKKHQLLVRANTNLGTVLINIILSAAIPCQRMGKNNVMLVCIPTPDSKPPVPTPVLIRVKSSEEADELLETLNKYKA